MPPPILIAKNNILLYHSGRNQTNLYNVVNNEGIE